MTSVALVTGANRGIGLEVTRQLAQQGMAMILGSRDLKKGEDAAKRFEDEGFDVRPHALDVTDEKLSIKPDAMSRRSTVGSTC